MTPGFHEIDGPAGDEERTAPPRRYSLDGEHLLNLANDAVRGVSQDLDLATTRHLDGALRRLEIALACVRLREALRSGTAP